MPKEPNTPIQELAEIAARRLNDIVGAQSSSISADYTDIDDSVATAISTAAELKTIQPKNGPKEPTSSKKRTFEQSMLELTTSHEALVHQYTKSIRQAELSIAEANPIRHKLLEKVKEFNANFDSSIKINDDYIKNNPTQFNPTYSTTIMNCRAAVKDLQQAWEVFRQSHRDLKSNKKLKM